MWSLTTFAGWRSSQTSSTSSGGPPWSAGSGSSSSSIGASAAMAASSFMRVLAPARQPVHQRLDARLDDVVVDLVPALADVEPVLEQQRLEVGSGADQFAELRLDIVQDHRAGPPGRGFTNERVVAGVALLVRAGCPGKPRAARGRV